MYEAAAGAGLTVGEYVRRLIVSAVTPLPPPDTVRDEEFRRALDATFRDHGEALRRLAMGPGDPRLRYDD